MLEWIIQYWIEVLFGIVVGFFGYTIRKKNKQEEEQKQINEAITAGMQALLKAKLTDMCEKYTQLGYCPIHIKELVEELYKPYAAIGGNGVGESSYKHIMNLPETKPNYKGSEILG